MAVIIHESAPPVLGNRPFHGINKHREAGEFGRASSGYVVPETWIFLPPETVGRMIVTPAGFEAGPPWVNRSRHRESTRPPVEVRYTPHRPFH